MSARDQLFAQPLGAAWRHDVRDRHAQAVGVSLFHTVGDRDRAVGQLQTAMTMLVNATKAGAASDLAPDQLVHLAATNPQAFAAENARINAARANGGKLNQLWQIEISPLLADWNAFYHDQSSWTEFTTSWEEYEHWSDRIKAAWERAKEAGAHLGAFGELSKTSLNEAADATKKLLTEAESVLKWLLVGGCALGGIYLTTQLVSVARKKK